MKAIPQEWIKEYVSKLLALAGTLQAGSFRDAIMLRADNAMDLVKAFREQEHDRQSEEKNG